MEGQAKGGGWPEGEKCWLFWEISKRGFDEGACPAS